MTNSKHKTLKLFILTAVILTQNAVSMATPIEMDFMQPIDTEFTQLGQTTANSQGITKKKLDKMAKEFLENYAHKLKVLHRLIRKKKESVEEDTPLFDNCSEKVNFLKETLPKKSIKLETDFMTLKNQFRKIEARARYVREMDPIKAKNTKHLDKVERKIEELVEKEKDLVKKFAVNQYELKKQEAELLLQIKYFEEMKKKTEENRAKSESLILDKEIKLEELTKKVTESKQNYEKKYKELVEEKERDPVKTYSEFTKQEKCFSEVTKISKVILFKEIQILKTFEEKIENIVTTTRTKIIKRETRIKEIRKRLRKLVLTKLKLKLEKPNPRNEQLIQILDKRIKNSKEKISVEILKIVKLEKSIKDKLETERNSIFIKKLKSSLHDLKDKDSIDRVKRALEKIEKLFTISHRRLVTVKDVLGNRHKKKKEHHKSLFDTVSVHNHGRKKNHKHDLFSGIIKHKKKNTNKMSIFGSATNKKHEHKKEGSSIFGSVEKHKHKKKKHTLFDGLVKKKEEGKKSIFNGLIGKKKPKDQLNLFNVAKNEDKNEEKHDLLSFMKKEAKKLEKKEEIIKHHKKKNHSVFGDIFHEEKKKHIKKKKTSSIFGDMVKENHQHHHKKKSSSIFSEVKEKKHKKHKESSIFGIEKKNKLHHHKHKKTHKKSIFGIEKNKKKVHHRHKKHHKSSIFGLSRNKKKHSHRHRKHSKNKSIFGVDQEKKHRHHIHKHHKRESIFGVKKVKKHHHHKHHKKISIFKTTENKTEKKFQRLIHKIELKAKRDLAKQEKILKEKRKKNRVFNNFKKMPKIPKSKEEEKNIKACKRLKIINSEEMAHKVEEDKKTEISDTESGLRMHKMIIRHASNPLYTHRNQNIFKVVMIANLNDYLIEKNLMPEFLKEGYEMEVIDILDNIVTQWMEKKKKRMGELKFGVWIGKMLIKMEGLGLVEDPKSVRCAELVGLMRQLPILDGEAIQLQNYVKKAEHQ